MARSSKSIIEVLAALTLIFGYIWGIIPLQDQWVRVVSLIPVLLFILSSKYVHSESFKDLGFRVDNLIPCLTILLIMIFVSIPVLYAVWKHFFPVDNQFYNHSIFWKKLLPSSVEALVQQYVVLAFFFRRFRDIFPQRVWVAVLLSALTFSLFHIPTPPLIIFCFIAGIIWALIYHRHPNLLAIAFSHMILGVFISNVLLVHTIVGPKADIGRWSKKVPPFLGYIDNINGKIPGKNTIVVAPGKNSLLINGWLVYTGTEKMERIFFRFNHLDYPVEYGLKRPDVARFYNNPEYLHSGLGLKIPISNLKPGVYCLSLIVVLEGKFFNRRPFKYIWIRLK